MAQEGQHSGIDDETRARARRFVEDADMPKPAVTANPKLPKQRVVSKKELEESGLSLRDFLNRERGLTRRSMSKSEAEKTLGMGEKPSSESVAKAKAQLGIEASDRNEDYGNEGLRKAEAPKKQDRVVRDTKPAAVNPKTLLPTGMKKGGKVKGWGMARGARKAKMR
jgi:hypothetical protein